jgi:hypothetical protein
MLSKSPTMASARALLAAGVAGALAGTDDDWAEGEEAGWSCGAALLVQPDRSPVAIMTAALLSVTASVFAVLTHLPPPTTRATPVLAWTLISEG